MSKKTEQKNIDKINRFESCVKASAEARGLSNGLSFDYKSDKDDKEMTACLKMNGYTVYIELSIFSNLITEIGHSIIFPKSNFEFYILDILTLFDIDDYKDYAYVEDSSEDFIEKTVEELFDMLSKYDYDIRKAGDDTHFPKLLKAKEKDLKYRDTDKMKIRDAMRLGTALTNYRRKPNDKTRQKYIEALEIFDSKGRLSAPDKRELEKLKSGEHIYYELEQGDIDHEYTKKWLKLAICFDLLITMVFFLFYAVVFVVRSKDGLVVNEGMALLGVFIASACASLSFDLGISHSIVQNKMLKQNKKPSKDAGITYQNKLEKIVGTKIIPILFPLAAVFLLLISFPNVSVVDDGIITYSLLEKTSISFESLEVYEVLGTTNSRDEFEQYSAPSYAFVDKDGNTYEIGVVKKQSQIDKLNEIFDKNNISPKQIKTSEELYNFE